MDWYKNFIQAIPGGEVLGIALTAIVLAQILKAFSYYFTNKKWDGSRMFGPGGMPSSHAAGVTAVSVGIGVREGWESPLFALAVVFSLVVLYDAAKIRRAAGEQAAVLNDLLQEVKGVAQGKHPTQSLQTILGHTYPQVFVGILLGMGIALAYFA